VADFDVSYFIESGAKLACVIVLQTLALVLWNVGSRPPLRLLRDVAGMKKPRKAFFALAGIAIGLMFVAAATALTISAIGGNPNLFVPFVLGTFLIAIAVDALVGDDLRRAVRR
jgi:hypothetical protein